MRYLSSFGAALALLGIFQFSTPASAQVAELQPQILLQPHQALSSPTQVGNKLATGKVNAVASAAGIQIIPPVKPLPADVNSLPVATPTTPNTKVATQTNEGALIAGGAEASDTNAAPVSSTTLPPPPQGPVLLRFLKSISGGAAAVPLEPPPDRRGLPAALDPVFPSTDFIGVAGQLPIGVPDSGAQYPLEKYLWKHCPLIKKARIRIYGWNNPGIEMIDTSKHSNYPMSYNQVPRQPVMDQQIIRIERVPDTVQKEHLDWGFRFSSLWGHDYRFTTSAGWLSSQLLTGNHLYGWDPVECYGVLYVPKVFDGMVVKVGRYISPPDIEAQLAPDNYLYSHSLMFTFDCYTMTGVYTSIKLNKQLTVSGGISAGNDVAPWTKGARPTGQWIIRWISKNNKDSWYGGMNSINNGYYNMTAQHINLQQSNLTWSHVFNSRVHTMTEAYFMYQFDALQGGTVNNGPPRWFYELTGPGRYLPGTSCDVGVVNYTNIKITNKDYITLRPIDYLVDCRGALTGFATPYGSWTIGWCHRFSDTMCIRPEIRYESALKRGITPYDNGTKASQFTIACDLIHRF